MRTTVEALEGNKVKLSVNVEDAEFEQALDQAFKRIAREVRIPGFRPGKAPRRILEARVGIDVARQEALRESLPEFYAKAVNESEVDVIAPPEIDITSGEESGPVAFDAVVEVRPKVTVAGYGSLRVTVPGPTATDEEVDAQVERLRQQFGELQTVERPAQDGDQVSIDIAGSVEGEPVEGLTADDYLYQVGTGAILPEVDEQLRGAEVGDILVFEARPPGAGGEDEDDEDEDASPITFRILVKDVKEQVLPDLDDDWANEASEFETVEALRDDLRSRIESVKRVQAQLALREGVVSALVELVDDEPPAPLVQSELEHRARELVQRLGAQGASVEQYLQATGRSGEELNAELTEAATSAVKADLGLRAVIEAEAIDVDDDEVDAEIGRIAARLDQKPEVLRKQLERADQVQAVRSDLRKGKALEWLVDHAEVVDEEGAPVDRSRLEMPSPDPQEEEADA